LVEAEQSDRDQIVDEEERLAGTWGALPSQFIPRLPAAQLQKLEESSDVKSGLLENVSER